MPLFLGTLRSALRSKDAQISYLSTLTRSRSGGEAIFRGPFKTSTTESSFLHHPSKHLPRSIHSFIASSLACHSLRPLKTVEINPRFLSLTPSSGVLAPTSVNSHPSILHLRLHCKKRLSRPSETLRLLEQLTRFPHTPFAHTYATMILRLRLAHFLISVFLFTSFTTAWPWPPSFPDLDSIIVRRQNSKSST